MCGLFGIAGNLNYKDKDVFNQLMVVSSLRGQDSTGIAAVSEKDEVEVLKMVGPPTDLLMHPKYDAVSRCYDKKALIGHVRKATQGGISRITAHPFEADHITMTHNGTLENWRSAYRSGGIEGSYQSDSQKLADAIAAMGIREAIEETRGAYALVWWDARRKSLNFLRNNQRPLWYAMNEKGDVLYWASEWKMLALVLDRNGVELWKNTDDGGTRFHPLPEDSHVEWDLGRERGKPNFGSITIVDEVVIEGGKNVKTHVPFTGSYHRQATIWDRDSRTFVETEKLPLTKTGNYPFGSNTTPLVDTNNNPLLLTPPDTIETESESPSTPSSTTNSQKKVSEKRGSRRSSTLTLVASNKKDTSDASKQSGVGTEANPLIEGYGGEYLDEKQYMARTDGKCTFCEADISFKEAENGHIVEFVDRDRFVCVHCHGARQAASC